MHAWFVAHKLSLEMHYTDWMPFFCTEMKPLSFPLFPGNNYYSFSKGIQKQFNCTDVLQICLLTLLPICAIEQRHGKYKDIICIKSINLLTSVFPLVFFCLGENTAFKNTLKLRLSQSRFHRRTRNSSWCAEFSFFKWTWKSYLNSEMLYVLHYSLTFLLPDCKRKACLH